jgi:putative salt-induced outer membrane protein YdiY
MRGTPSIRASLVLLLLLVLQPVAAAAGGFIDKITIKDGSVLKGEIKRVENDELILDTDYADDVVIDVEHIVNIKSKQQFSVRLITGEIISGFLAVSKGKIVLRENLPAPGEPKAEEEPTNIDFAKPASEIPPTMPDPGMDEVVEEAPSIAESQPQQAPPDDLERDEETVEIAETAEIGPEEIPAAVERPGGRQFSFDDVDWIREKPTYLRYDADLNVGVQLARGNTDTTDLHFDARFEPSFGWNTLRLSGKYDKKSADDETTTNRWKASLVYERDFRRRWFVGAANTYESDAQRDLDLRFIVAAGVGYRFFDNDPTHLSVLPALAYVNENFKTVLKNVQTDPDPAPPIWEKSSDDTDYAAFQLNFDFTRDLYKDDIKFFHNNMYLQSFQDISDIIIETRTGISFDMAWDLVLTAEVETDWENVPAEDAKKWDTRYMLKIGFEFEGDEDDWFQ